jgi:hypothetical protein
MSTARIVFQKLIQDSQDDGSFEKSDDHLVSIVQFATSIDGRDYGGMSAEVRQPYRTDYEADVFEVGPIIGPYTGPWNHNSFAERCEQYVRSLIGSSGHCIRIEGGANIRMRNNVIVSEGTAEIEIPESGPDA